MVTELMSGGDVEGVIDESTMVNAVLVAEGYAQVATYPLDVKYVDTFVELRRLARAEGRGLWGLTAATPAPSGCDPSSP